MGWLRRLTQLSSWIFRRRGEIYSLDVYLVTSNVFGHHVNPWKDMYYMSFLLDLVKYLGKMPLRESWFWLRDQHLVCKPQRSGAWGSRPHCCLDSWIILFWEPSGQPVHRMEYHQEAEKNDRQCSISFCPGRPLSHGANHSESASSLLT